MKNLKIKQSKTGDEESSETASSLSFFGNLNFLLKLKKTISRFLLILILLLVSIAGINNSMDLDNMETEVVEVQKDQETIYAETVNQKFYEELVTEVDSFIKRKAPDSKLTAIYLVDKCLEYDTDIHFVLAQALLESHFGTKGKAAETNSVWNVGTFDDGQILYNYEHPDSSIVPYLKLINEKYLVSITSEGDTIKKPEEHLVEDRGYKNINGLRFASARGYENDMRKLMIRIDSETSIKFYQKILRLPSEDLIAYFVPSKDKVNYELLQANR